MAQISATVRPDTVEFFTRSAKKKGISFSQEVDLSLTKLMQMKFDDLSQILSSFGEYVLSDERANRVLQDAPPETAKEKLKVISIDDLRFWNEKVQILDI